MSDLLHDADGNRYIAYLFAHMVREDYGRLYYSISLDGWNWTRLAGGKRINDQYWGHTSLIRGHDGRFYTTGNRDRGGPMVVWASSDLVEWNLERELSVTIAGVSAKDSDGHPHYGAPKIYYDANERQYLLSWHSPVGEPAARTREYWEACRTFCITSRDLTAFSEPAPLFGFDSATIDAIVLREAGRYYAIVKDERWPEFSFVGSTGTGKTIRIASSANLTGPYGDPSASVSPNWREAPTAAPRLDGLAWFLYYENYPESKYECSVAPSIEGPWIHATPALLTGLDGVKHGSVLPITGTQYQTVMRAYGRDAALR